MAIWYAYRMNVKAFGAGNTLIANKCLGSLPDKSCTFDELVRYISHDPLQTTSVGTNLKPDVVATAHELKNQGYKSAYKLPTLFPTQFQGKKQCNFSQFWTALADNIQASRQKLGDGSWADELFEVRRAMALTHDARREDQAQHVIQGVDNIIQKKGFQWVRQSRAPHARSSWILSS